MLTIGTVDGIDKGIESKFRYESVTGFKDGNPLTQSFPRVGWVGVSVFGVFNVNADFSRTGRDNLTVILTIFYPTTFFTF